MSHLPFSHSALHQATAAPLLAAALLFAWPTPAVAVTPKCKSDSDMLIVLDASGSMTGTKWTSASTAVGSLLSKFGGKVRFGLMLFPGPGDKCGAGKVEVKMGKGNKAAMLAALKKRTPAGQTPMGATLKAARTYLGSIDPKKTKYVVIISDGGETCTGDPVSAVKALAKAKVTTFVVGFGAAVNSATLKAMAVAGGAPLKTAAKYYQATSSAQLVAALQKIGAVTDCCGNGVLDVGEKCDTAIKAGKKGACPTVCKDADPCTKDAIVGLKCDAVCKHSPVMKLVNGDGCCPPGAHYLLDTDCPNNCGDGKLSPGEYCDTAITAGSPGACPTSCDDGKPCTADALVGTLCWTRCVYVPITLAQAGDGCCPPGATEYTDADCPRLCGNGKLDPGEACDTLITSGAGSCPTLADCDDGEPCTKDTLSGATCLAKCVNATLPPSDENKDGCCPKGMTRLLDADCPPACGPDRQKDCIDLCKGIECSPGFVCSYGKCVPAPQGGPGQDGGSAPPGPNLDGPESGCSCTAGGSVDPFGPLLLLVVVVLGRRLRATRRR